MRNGVVSCVYTIRNLINGHRYIGSAVDLRIRVNLHRSQLRRGIHHSRYLQRAWNLHGEDNFIFEAIEMVGDKCQLIIREQYYIDTMKPEYNCAPTAGSMLGFVFSGESLKKLLTKNIGRKRSPEFKAKIAASRRGVRASTQVKANMSRAQKAVWSNPEYRARMTKVLIDSRQGTKSKQNLVNGIRAAWARRRSREKKRDLPYGVMRDRGKFRACSYRNSGSYSLGCYATPEEAGEVVAKFNAHYDLTGDIDDSMVRRRKGRRHGASSIPSQLLLWPEK